MELKELKCKNCGANIEVEKDATTATCKFCNTTFSVESAENTGYEFEKGRIKAQKEELSNNIDGVMSEENKKIVGNVFKGFAVSTIISSVIFFIMFFVVLGFIIFVGFKAFQTVGQNEKSFDVSDFNFDFENENGTRPLALVKNTLDDVITSNKKNDRKITVIYKDTKTSDPDKIKDLKNSFTESKYEVSFNYDDDGYIYEVVIEDYKGI